MNKFYQEEKTVHRVLAQFRERQQLDVELETESVERLARGSDLQPFLQGRLTEVSGAGGGASLTFAFSVLSQAQRLDESVLWLSSSCKPFYPPDVVRAGVDLSRLPVVFLPRVNQACLAATRLLGSGGFGLLVWDLASWKKVEQELPLAFLGRLQAMARHYRASVLILTDKAKEQPSLGCLVSLRLQVEAVSQYPDLVEVEVVRDKRGVAGFGRRWQWRCQLPDGMPTSSPAPLASIIKAKAAVARPKSRLVGKTKARL